MFTGIIEDIGTVKTLQSDRRSMEITVISPKIVADVKLGDSIAVNGVCLTVTHYNDQELTMDVMPETVKATNLQQLTVGNAVNLERAMPANGRFGGHFVSGHVDGVGKILRKRPMANAVYIEIELSEDLTSYCIPKGSITIDGTSLTLFHVEKNSVTVSLIPHTYKETVLGIKNVGALVNIETDLVGKYIIHQLKGSQQSSTITKDYLAKHGF
ncbi:riboflavin synthase [Lysinibacillus sphaericus]|uniref:Riboflavin synthase n=2 Tax=Lysinibacillus TaxID=400634 RepID=A0A2S0K2D8_LYSSH|nr:MULTISPECIES: riboflavin synthase [Lysinibacillus]AVK97488.1 riboflavin synthase [Lysinibacillus sphaericus]MED4545994.1 riboflavin synthase [Lysinibacillus sphaericus]TKI16188.1 riboflavin synthase [Lysinibacillus sphaericus]TKI47865.1 riboflavin synthase [Lysinibacillus tabacifolii]SUV16605.1 riboflavin synthase subunit alpha [Lysinibacillus sphaericus]